jgi:hypothetical protein
MTPQPSHPIVPLQGGDKLGLLRASAGLREVFPLLSAAQSGALLGFPLLLWNKDMAM